ncbi:MAG: sigma-70 family RNA polymerase sigma factor [Nitrospinae bacterium]|nr:sigma-70 family RNA polymerase sigma factor [Nitrospinota bacterium]MBL7020915.1 sigma-70 family RNA polymerase sigma factor [Nitrospinaceae bacterium]
MSKEILDPQKWVELYADMMYRFALVRVKDPEAADELVQATFFAALKSQHTFAGKSSEKTWLFGILKHKIMDHFRSSKKHISIDLTSNEGPDRIKFDSSGHMSPKPGNWNIDPEKAAENNELAQVLAECLKALPKKYHKLFILREIDGLSSDEICKEFNIKPTNLWVILHRARNQLKLCLETNWLNTK